MDGFWRWGERLRRLIFKSRVEQEVEAEMQHHIDMEARERVEEGMDPASARRAARVDFGSVERYRAEARDIRWAGAWDVLAQDVRYAVRMLWTNPGFTGVALLTLALGIGASTAVFSLVNAVLLRPLPYGAPEEIVWIQTQWKGSPNASISPAEFIDYRDRLTDVFSSVGVYVQGSVNVTGEGEPKRIPAGYFSAQMLPALGVSPRVGRGWTEEEDLAGSSVVLLSDSFWRQHFAADDQVVGETVTINGRQREVIGVMPVDFALPSALLTGPPSGLYLPLSIDPATVTNRGSHYLFGVARVREAVSRLQAKTAFENLVGDFSERFPDAYTADMGFRATTVPLAEMVRGPVRMPLLVLAVAVAFVLAITGANVAGLLLARSDRREREFALRSALGAGRSRVISQVVVESTLLALAGGVLGLFVAQAITAGLVSLLPIRVPWLEDVDLNSSVLAFAALLSAVTGFIFGLLPALGVGRSNIVSALKEGSRTSSGSLRSQRLRRRLVIGEVAVALVLLCGAGLLGRSFTHLLRVDPGFQTENVVTTRLSLPSSGYPENENVTGFFRELTGRLNEMPAVARVGAVTNLPLATRLGDMNFTIEGRPIPERSKSPAADWQVVTPGYFEAMGLNLLRGRVIEPTDVAGSVGVVVINETFAQTHWPDENPLGKRFTLGGERTQPEMAEIIGIVRDVRHESLAQDLRPQMYFAHEQFRFWSNGRAVSSMNLVVQSSLPMVAVRSSIREAVSALDANLPLANLRTMAEVRGTAVAVPRLLMTVTLTFSAVAFLLAVVGIYGVMAYTVSKRIPEFGIRLMLGAQPAEVSRMVLAQGARLAFVGIVLGLAGVFVVTRGIADLLYGISPFDPLTLVGAALLLGMAAMVACYAPALRATKVDPVKLLRAD